MLGFALIGVLILVGLVWLCALGALFAALYGLLRVVGWLGVRV